jgi:hypothetical protein
MKTNNGKKCRITLLLTAGKLAGMHVKERSRDGKYAPLDRPWGGTGPGELPERRQGDKPARARGIGLRRDHPQGQRAASQEA